MAAFWQRDRSAVDNTLMTSQKNQVLEWVLGTRFDPMEFVWETVMGTLNSELEVSRLWHHPSSSYFVFDRAGGGKHYGVFSPGSDTRVSNTEYAMDGPNLLGHVGAWPENLRREGRPRPWALLQGFPQS